MHHRKQENGSTREPYELSDVSPVHLTHLNFSHKEESVVLHVQQQQQQQQKQSGSSPQYHKPYSYPQMPPRKGSPAAGSSSSSSGKLRWFFFLSLLIVACVGYSLWFASYSRDLISSCQPSSRSSGQEYGGHHETLGLATLSGHSWGGTAGRSTRSSSSTTLEPAERLCLDSNLRGRGGKCSRQAQIVVKAEGRLTERMEALCFAQSVARRWQLALAVIWEKDEFIPSAKFSDLFDNPEIAIVETTEDQLRSLEANYEQKFWHQPPPPAVDIANTQAAAAAGTTGPGFSFSRDVQISKTLSVWVAKTVLADVMAELGNSPFDLFRRRISRCYSRFKPSVAVATRMQEEDLERLQRTTGVYIEGPLVFPCPGCPPSELLNCTIRRLALSLLAHPSSPSSRFSVVSFWPSLAQTTAASFHPKVAPLLLEASRFRAQFCPDPKLPPPAIEPSPPTLSEKQEEMAWLKSQGNASSSSTGGEKGGREGKGGEEAHSGGEGEVLVEGRHGEILDEKERRMQENGSGVDQEGGASDESIGEGEEEKGEGRQEGEWGVSEDGEGAGNRGQKEESRDNVGGEEEEGGQKEEEEEGAGHSGQDQEDEASSETGSSSMSEDGAEEGEEAEEENEDVGAAEGSRKVPAGRKLLASQGEEGASSSKQQDLSIACVQSELAELFLLSHTQGLHHCQDSVQSRFIEAQADRIESESGLDGSDFTMYASICSSPPQPPLTSRRWAHQIIFDENLKLAYCWLPKVACTSWKAWFSSQRKLHQSEHATSASSFPASPVDVLESHNANRQTELKEFLSLHRAQFNGLGEMWFHYAEWQAIYMLTSPEFFKFTFVRNPFNRIASAFFNKIVDGGGADHHGTSWWTSSFFSHIRILPKILAENNGTLKFGSFVMLTSLGLDFEHLKMMDTHIALQTDVCAMESIKYDFVGRFEDLQSGVDTLMKKFGTSTLDAFDYGKSVHPTNSSSRLSSIFDKVSYGRVKKMYARDLHIVLNNVTYEPPAELASVFEDTFHPT